MDQIVDETDEKEKRAGEQDLRTVGRVKREQQQRDDHRQPDRGAAEHRGRFFMPAIRLWLCDKAEAPGERLAPKA